MQLHDHAAEFEALAVDLVAVAPSTAGQADRLAERGVSHQLLLDPDKALRSSVGLGKLRLRDWFRPATAGNYIRALGRGRQGSTRPSNMDDLPGVMLVDRSGRLARRWDGRTLGDYPAVVDVLSAVREIS